MGLSFHRNSCVLSSHSRTLKPSFRDKQEVALCDRCRSRGWKGEGRQEAGPRPRRTLQAGEQFQGSLIDPSLGSPLKGTLIGSSILGGEENTSRYSVASWTQRFLQALFSLPYLSRDKCSPIPLGSDFQVKPAQTIHGYMIHQHIRLISEETVGDSFAEGKFSQL